MAQHTTTQERIRYRSVILYWHSGYKREMRNFVALLGSAVLTSSAHEKQRDCLLLLQRHSTRISEKQLMLRSHKIFYSHHNFEKRTTKVLLLVVSFKGDPNIVKHIYIEYFEKQRQICKRRYEETLQMVRLCSSCEIMDKKSWQTQQCCWEGFCRPEAECLWRMSSTAFRPKNGA